MNEVLKFLGKFTKKKSGGGVGSGGGQVGLGLVGGIRVDVIEESKFLGKLTKKIGGGVGSGGGQVGGRVGGGDQGGCENQCWG